LQEAVANDAEVIRLTEKLDAQQVNLNQAVSELQIFKDVQETRSELKAARERAAEEAEAEGDLVEGVLPQELGDSIGFLVLLELGRMGVCSSIYQAVEPNMEALWLFSRLLTTRVRMLGAYFSWCKIEDVEGHAQKMGIERGWLYRRCGPPYRFLCKTSVHLATMVSHLDLPDILFTAAAYRLYWNSPEAWEQFLAEYHPAGSKETGLLIADFQYGKFLKAVNAVEAKRNAAYLMGCKGKRGFADKMLRLKEFIPNLVEYFGLVPDGQIPDKERSTLILRNMQRGMSHFHGMQLFLDAGFFCKRFCTPGLVLECGPGAADTIMKIFPILGSCSGKMSRNRAVELACAPFFQKLSDILLDEKLAVGKELREAVVEFHFPDMTLDHLQYFACEKRQWANHLTQPLMTGFPSAWNHPYMESGLALPFFIEVMPMSRFNPHAVSEVARMATPQAKKVTYANRGLGPSISDAADPPKRVQHKAAVDVD